MSEHGILDLAATSERDWADGDLAVTVPQSLRPALMRACRDKADALLAEAARLSINDSDQPEDPEMATFLGQEPGARARQAERRISDLKTDWLAAQALGDALVGRAPTSADAAEAGWADGLRRAIWDHRQDRDARFGEERARAERSAEAEAMTWQEMAEALWGPDYQTPLSIVTGVNIRTIQRAVAPGGTLSGGIVNWLDQTMALVPADLRRAYGQALRGGRSVAGGAAAVERALLDLSSHRLP